MKTNRELALEWWQSLPRWKQTTKIIKHIPNRPKVLYSVDLTEIEIEEIWKRETQDKHTKTDREKALEWFGNLGMRKYTLLKENNIDLGTQSTEGFKLRIEELWRKENTPLSNVQQDLINESLENLGTKQIQVDPIMESINIEEWLKDDSDPVQPEVDFEMLKEWYSSLSCDNYNYIDKYEYSNIQLFFKLLSTDPDFANVAYKELNELNK
jgi:hypothetical protein